MRALSQQEAQLREQIWTEYVQRMVEQKGDAKHYPLTVTIGWLGWQASEMRRHHQAIFSLEILQPDWLPMRQRNWYLWSVGLGIGLIGALIVGLGTGLMGTLISGVSTELITWLGIGLLAGLSFGLPLGLILARDTQLELAAADQLHNGAQVIVNGITGEVLIEPDEAAIAAYRQQMQALAQSWSEALQEALAHAITADGKQVKTVANIISPADAARALEYGAEGVGLLRSEFLFLDHDTEPDEDEQFAVYSAIMETMGQRPVVIRTLDIGGAKPASYLNMPQEVNPSLGVRGVRFSLANPEMFQVQLRALLRAGVGHNLKIMFPMVATREEVLAAREQLAAARKALTERGVPFSQQYEVGIMVEVPATALMADVLAGMVDFFSIGTNDLSQYTLAADRRNATVAPLADVLHPAVLLLIRMVIDAAHVQGKWVGLCGDLAGDPLAVSVLLGLGLDEFSMTARSIPLVKQAIRRCTLVQAREIAQHALAMGDAGEVRAYLRSL